MVNTTFQSTKMRAMELFSVRHILIFFIVPLLPIAAIFLIFFHHRTQSKHKTCSLNTLKAYPLLGHIPHFIRNRHRFLEWITEVLAEAPTQTMSLFSPISRSRVITGNPSNVEHILKTNFSNYPKGQKSIADLHDFLGDGIFNSDDEQWRWQRKAVSFEFSTRSLRSFVMDTVQQEIASRLLPLLSRAAAEESRAGSIVDLQDVLERFAFDNICVVSFGEDPGSLTEEKMKTADQSATDFMRAFGEAQNLLTVRLMEPSQWIWVIKRLLNIGTEKQLREVIPTVHGYAESIIRTRAASAVCRDDLLSRVAAANKGITNKQLRDIVISFILAGRETTSSALTWFFWILSTRPDVERRILAEIRSARKDKLPGDEAARTFSYEELREMQYLHATITESMRLYPPVPVDTVSCLNEDVLPDGTSVGKGWFVSYSAYAMGRLKSIWGADCGEYRPERWLDEEGVFRPESPFRFSVFHAGPRACLGKEMSYLQMKSVVACVLERFEIEVVRKGEEVPEHVLSFTLRMKGGLPVRIKARRANGPV